MKNAIVTGASRGIGCETVKALIDRDCRVIALARTATGLDELSRTVSKPAYLKTLVADITDSRQDAPLKDAVDSFFEGRMNCLINNAGLLVKKPFKALTAEDFDRAYRVNVWAPVRLMQLLLPSLAKGAHIVNLVTMGSLQGSTKFPGLAAYSSSKAALANLTESLAVEWKSRDIRINGLALGAVQTQMLETAFPGYRAPLSATQMGTYIADFALRGSNFYNGKILPVSVSTP